MKHCIRCNTFKDFRYFYKWKRGKDGYQVWCKTCDLRYKKETNFRIRLVSEQWRKRNPEKWRASVSKRVMLYRYGLTETDHEALLKEHANRCGICGVEMQKLNIDHCHKTNRVRGLLCGPCNRGLGCFNDSTEKLSKAIRYLGEVRCDQYKKRTGK